MKKFIGEFHGMKIYLDDEMDRAAIALIDHLKEELKVIHDRGDATDASMYRLLKD